MCSPSKKFDAYGKKKGSGRSPSARSDEVRNGRSEIARYLDASTGILTFALLASHLS